MNENPTFTPEQFRQHLSDEPLAGRSSTDGLRFMALKHPYLMFAALMGIALIALVIVLAFVLPH